MSAQKRLAALDEAIEAVLDGSHTRLALENKRLCDAKAAKHAAAKRLRDFRVVAVNDTCDAEKAVVHETFERERSAAQERLINELVERQKRQTKGPEAPELRAVTRKMKQQRGDAAASSAKSGGKRDAKAMLAAVPLRYGEVEEDFEAMAGLASKLAPHLDIDLELEVAPGKRMQPVETSSAGRDPLLYGRGVKRHADFDFKGKPRSEVVGARITVWYEEEHGGRKMDVPYQGVVSSHDKGEGLYVKFQGFAEEMLITNEDDWRWGSHSKKPPTESARSR